MSAFDGVNSLRFDDNALKAAVSPEVYAEWHSTVADGTALSKASSKSLAKGIMGWALERGATNFSHWFFPQRGMSAGTKLDAFVNLDFGSDKALKDIVSPVFGGGQLFMSETDGSSFPNGGLRATHTAAAYMAWDRSSPPFIKGDTVYFPCAFATWSGHALDYKTPLLRSQRAVSDEGVRLLKHMGHTDVEKVHANVGWEQEFFIIPRELYNARPDLVNTGRTVIGKAPAREQQNSDHYFTPMVPRVKEFSERLQEELWKVGISNSVIHNEVAPGQHEISPIFALTNVAADQNILTVELMESIAADLDLFVLNHEKPFGGMNGSGKHCNWGLNTDTGINLYNPADGEEEFMVFTAAMFHAINNYPEVLRASFGSSTNDYRLGGHEAPPAILSVCTGETLGKHIEGIAAGGPLTGYGGAGQYGGKTIDFGAPETAPVGGSLEDRNRTAPVPFCGNRYEFRAVGSYQNISDPLTAINTSVAEGLSVISDLIEGGMTYQEATAKVYKDNMRILFNGDGYDTAWHHEAEFERGLPNLPTTVDALELFHTDKVKALFSKHNVYSEAEVDAVTNVKYERYALDLLMDVDTTLEMINQGVLPAAAADLKSYDGTNLSGDRATVYEGLAASIAELQKVKDAWPTDGSEKEQAVYAKEVAKVALGVVRESADAAEGLINSDLYPFPTYHEMLFLHKAHGRSL
jgi:glutamine synthetase